MVKKHCSAGLKWDNVVKACAKTNIKTEPPTKPPLQADVGQVRDVGPATQADSLILLTPVLWVFVVLATVGSMLVLALWFIIYRRQIRINGTTEPVQKTETLATIHHLPSERDGQAETFQRGVEAPSSPCAAQQHPGAHTGTCWYEERPVAGMVPAAEHAEKDGERGLPAWSSSEHRIPLPATELGGTALVTTKTV
ncbi:hypothetical protein JOB18_012667 [Solea senegalensis]|uniref:Uncharacterized protein n=1 Tax=Solea senegalensis TaxID=28829 RepID=A0AAV6RGP5_SOLSE|nr:hypothetical protein JOB18_012667 [Solea senegalensis]